MSNLRMLEPLFVLLIFLSGCGRSSVTRQNSDPVISETSMPLVQQTPAAVILSTMNTPIQSSTGMSELEKITPDNASRLANIAVVGEGDFADEIAISVDGKLFAVATQGGVVLYDTDSGARQDFLPTFSRVASLDFSPTGNLLAEVHMLPGGEVYPDSTFIAGMETYVPVLTVWNTTSGERVLTQALAGRGCGDDLADDLHFSPDGHYLLFRDFASLRGYGRSDNLCVILAADGSLVKTIPIIPPWESSSPAFFSADGQSVWVAVKDATAEETVSRLQRYEIATGNMVQELWVQGWIVDLNLSKDGKVLAAADPSGASIVSAIDGQSITRITSNQKDIRSIDLSLNGNLLLLGSEDGQVSFWELPSGSLLWKNSIVPTFPWPGSLEEIPMRAWDVAFSEEENRVFILRQNSSLHVNNLVQALTVTDGQELFTNYGRNSLGEAQLSPDTRLAAFGGYEDGKVQLWSVAQNELFLELKGHTGMVYDTAFSPDGSQLASASADGTIKLWQPSDGALISTLVSHKGKVWLVAYSPDGTQLASIGDDAMLRIWNTVDETLLQSIPTQGGDWIAPELTYALDGSSMLLAYRSVYWEPSLGGLYRINLQTGSRETLLDYSISDVSYSADQSTVGIQSSKGNLSGNLALLDFKQYSSPMGNGSLEGAAISPDGNLFISGNGYGLHVWNAVNGELIAILAGSNGTGNIMFTQDQRMVMVSSWDGTISIWGISKGN